MQPEASLEISTWETQTPLLLRLPLTTITLDHLSAASQNLK